MRVSAPMMMGLLLLAPVLATAKSEFATCLEAQNRAQASTGVSRPVASWRPMATYVNTSVSPSGAYFYPTYAPGPSYFSLDFQADRMTAMVRNCRQFKKKPAPVKFRVVGIKSPAQKQTVNRADSGAK